MIEHAYILKHKKLKKLYQEYVIGNIWNKNMTNLLRHINVLLWNENDTELIQYHFVEENKKL